MKAWASPFRPSRQVIKGVGNLDTEPDTRIDQPRSAGLGQTQFQGHFFADGPGRDPERLLTFGLTAGQLGDGVLRPPVGQLGDQDGPASLRGGDVPVRGLQGEQQRFLVQVGGYRSG